MTELWSQQIRVLSTVLHIDRSNTRGFQGEKKNEKPVRDLPRFSGTPFEEITV
jgi:hypothetical protein